MTAAINLNSHINNCSFINSRLQIGPTLSLQISFLHRGALSADAVSNSYSLHSLGVLSAHTDSNSY